MSELSDRLRDMLATQTGDFTLSSEDRSSIAQLFAEAGQDEQLVLAALVQRVLQEHPGHLQAQYARATAEELGGEHEAAGPRPSLVP